MNRFEQKLASSVVGFALDLLDHPVLESDKIKEEIAHEIAGAMKLIYDLGWSDGFEEAIKESDEVKTAAGSQP
jgi:hypothetical protein